MNPRLHPSRAVARLWLGLVALSCVFAPIAIVDAQVPVITNPGDLRTLTVNTAFRPGDPDPAWTVMAPMPTARAGFATAAAFGRVYAIGGAVLNNCVTVPTVEAYDPAGDFWIAGFAPLPPPLRYRPAGATLDNLIYVVGGSATESICNDTALGTVQAYDPGMDSWSEKLPLNVPRLQVGLGVDPVNHLLYAVGGATAAPHYTALDTVEVYDPATDTWVTKQHLNTPRGFPAIAAVNGKIYAIGGQTEELGTINSVEEFDPAANVWTTKPSRMPHPRRHSAAAIVDGKVYIMGGSNRGAVNGMISTVDVYDPSRDLWTTETSLPTPRQLLGAATVDNTIYAVGGEALVARVGERFTYQITATNNPTSYDASPLPEGLSVDSERGIISGIPTTAAQGFVITFTATNPSGSDSRDVSLFIAQARASLLGLASIISSTCATGRAGQPFTYQVLTDNASSEAQLAATGLPYEAGVGGGPQMNIDPGTGLISGMVPLRADASSRSFGVELDFTNGESAQSYLQLTFVSDPSFPVITSSSNASLVLNQFFSYTITADAPVSSFDYLGLDGALDGSLPTGLSFDPATGTISGIYRGDLASRPVTGAFAKRGAKNGHLEGRTKRIDTIKKEPPPRIQMLTMQEEAGTGTAPLNFFIGLHDLEVETLPASTSKGTNYAIFTDDLLTSGSGAGMLKSAKAGDYVSYTVPVPAPGAYDVKVGIKTGENQGIFQLSIDDANQGSPQDEYSSGAGYEVRDLGPVTFSSAGNKTFRFSTTGLNPQSGGYALVFDYLDLVPHYEAESLFVQAHSAPYVTIHDPSRSGRAGTLLKAIRRDDYLTYTVPVAKAGVYNLRVKTKGEGNGGSFRLSIDGVTQGYLQREDCGSCGDDGAHDLGTVTFRSAGEKSFQFLVTRGEPDGTSEDFILDYIDLVLTTHLEAEKLSADASAQFVRVTDVEMSRRAGVLLNAQAPGDSVTFNVTIPVAGTYGVKFGMRTGEKSGIVQVAIDGVNQGAAQDGYSAKVGYQVLDLGRVTFTEAGEKNFQFVVTGQNSASSGYQFVLDYIDLVR